MDVTATYGTPVPAPPVPEAVEAAPETVPVLRGSPLASLRARREAIQEKLFIDLKVPRWDDDGGARIYVRYGPISPSHMGKVVERRQKAKPRAEDWMVLANCDALIAACIGVFAIEDDVTPEAASRSQQISLRDGDPTGEWTKFDKDLAFSLGLSDTARAVDVIRGIYHTDGDLIVAAKALLDWSGLATPQADEDFFGS